MPRPAYMAAHSPAGPPPTMMRSYRLVVTPSSGFPGHSPIRQDNTSRSRGVPQALIGPGGAAGREHHLPVPADDHHAPLDASPARLHRAILARDLEARISEEREVELELLDVFPVGVYARRI